MQNGLHAISEQEHRALTDYPSISELKLLETAPLLFKYAKTNPKKSQSKAQIEGTMFHMAILEPERYINTVRTFPEDLDFRTKEGKETKALILAEQAKGHEFLPASLIDRIAHCRNDLMDNPLVMDLLDGCEVERTAIWEDTDFNIKVRGRMDAYHEGRGYIFDLKTTMSAPTFENQIIKYSYHKQAAFYADGLSQILGKPFDFYWLVVEKTPPFLYRILKADKTMLEVGRMEYKKLLDVYCRCRETGKWEGLGNKVETVSFPEWYLSKYSAPSFGYDDEEHDG